MKYLIIAVVLLSGCVTTRRCNRISNDAFEMGVLQGRFEESLDRLKKMVNEARSEREKRLKKLYDEADKFLKEQP